MITKLSQHWSDARKAEEGQRIAVEVLKIFGQAAATVEPSDSPLNDSAQRSSALAKRQTLGLDLNV